MFCQNVFDVRRDYHKNAIPTKEKRSRTAFTPEQLNYLEREYKSCPYSEHDRLSKIANIIGKPEKVVKIWFQNRRSRERKSNKINTTEKNRMETSAAMKSFSTPISNGYEGNMPTSIISTTQFDYNQIFQMAQNKNIMSETNQPNTSKQAANLHKIINNVRKEAHPKLNPANCKHKIIKTKSKIATTKINKNGLANNTSVCYGHPKTIEVKPEKDFVYYNNANLPNTSNFFISGNNSAINFVPKELTGFSTKHVSQNNLSPKGIKQDKRLLHNVHQIQGTRKTPKQCSCNCKLKTKQTGAQNVPNPQLPYVILIPCLK